MGLMFLRKITTATMGFSTSLLEDVARSSEKPVSVLRIWGMVSDQTQGTSQFGSYQVFKGQFGGLNLLEGTEARSEKLLLPAVAEAVVQSMFERAAKEGGTAQIALEVTVQFNNSQKGGTKFSYGVKPLIEFTGDDALSLMAKKLPPPVIIKALPKKK